MRTAAVVGKNFGDEGKGLAVDYLARLAKRPLVVRHNGGAQSGHTVEQKGPEGKRFVFHSLSSGSLHGAGTLWIGSFYPDLYKLGEEAEAFRRAFGFVPQIYAMEDTCFTVPDDVLVNLALELSRGERRHGSCGMGINECDLRVKAGHGLPLGRIAGMGAKELWRELRGIRDKYTVRRLTQISPELTDDASAYTKLLCSENVLANAAETMAENLRYVTVLTQQALREILAGTDLLIFESGQGLLLDRDNEVYAPHVTASSTGLVNPCAFLEQLRAPLDEVIYVSRAYVTRHGAGPLPCECPKEELGDIEEDRTNTANQMQGMIRYARHENEKTFVGEVRRDLAGSHAEKARVSLFLTHLNETGNQVMLESEAVPAEAFFRLPEIARTFDTFYLSASRYAEDVRILPEVGGTHRPAADPGKSNPRQ